MSGSNPLTSNTVETIQYNIFYGPEDICDREMAIFSDYIKAFDFFTMKSRTMHVDAFKVRTVTTTTTENMS